MRLFAEPSRASTEAFDKKMPLAGLYFLLDRGSFPDDATQRHLAANIRSLGGSLLAAVSVSLWSDLMQLDLSFPGKCN